MNFNNHNEIKAYIAGVILEQLVETGLESPPSTEQISKLLSPPPKKNMGDLAFPCFLLAKELKSSPAKISSELSEKILPNDLVNKCQAFGPYINFFLSLPELAKQIIPNVLDETFFKKSLSSDPPKTIIEFSQPNTHKELHVGHMRNLCLGDALVKMYRYAGIPTLSTTFPGDVGTHVAKCLWYYTKHNKEKVPETKKGAWLGKLYTKGNNLLEEQKGSEHEDENRAELTKILQELHQGHGKYFDLWKETRQWSVELMQDVYSWADVEFDSWYWESDVDASSVELIKKFQASGLFVKDQGAVGINLEDEKLGFCLLLKSDGTGLYATKDLELARRKFEDHKIEKSIYVVDNRQAHHFKQVFTVLDKMGFENAKNCYHLEYDMVELSSGAMSSRKGNIVPLQELIDQMVLKIKTDYLNKYETEWSAEKIDETANVIAAGAIKYGMTKIDSHKKIVFDMNEWLKLDGDSGPYIQYVHARIQSMLTKSDFDLALADFSELKTDSEKEVLNHLCAFNDIIESCVDQNKTHILCSYLYQLAKSYNSFYAECPILKADIPTKHARLALSKATATTLRRGLALIGVTAPDRM